MPLLLRQVGGRNASADCVLWAIEIYPQELNRLCRDHRSSRRTFCPLQAGELAPEQTIWNWVPLRKPNLITPDAALSLAVVGTSLRSLMF